MTPVIYLSDAFLATGSEPWAIPDVADLPGIEVENHTDPATFQPYARDPETLARPWAVPGTPGLEHRIGGLEKADITGNVSYDPENHHRMQMLRAEKIAASRTTSPTWRSTAPQSGDLLVLGWGSTYGAIRTAVERLQAEGQSGRPRPPAPPQPVPAQPRRGARRTTARCSSPRSTWASCAC